MTTTLFTSSLSASIYRDNGTFIKTNRYLPPVNNRSGYNIPQGPFHTAPLSYLSIYRYQQLRGIAAKAFWSGFPRYYSSDHWTWVQNILPDPEGNNHNKSTLEKWVYRSRIQSIEAMLEALQHTCLPLIRYTCWDSDPWIIISGSSNL